MAQFRSPLPRRAVLAVMLVALTGCGVVQSGVSWVSGGGRVSFDDKYYRAKLTKDDEAPQKFSVTVNKVSQSLAGAKEAGRYESVKYCMKFFGWSGVDWTIGPDDPDSSLIIVDDTLTLKGECKGWL
ncbi:hypothetical protein [Pseudooceanicola sp.]|uniref:hypothetical protein n=1 Tax=Pseudooceanicola sp. TaxID=1914328 RepID=UPI00261DBD36|nr:hypothetical protein [Pseudooceanicola sp.]MDF1855511.1 hypothetical protein [Pseudooceanicola sp.]